jgi:polysaccharide pyruvyl transferase WcaK-like protein
MGGYTRNNMFGLRVEYEELLYGLIDFLIENKCARVLLIPHVFGSGGESDSAVCERIYEQLKNKYPGSLGLVRGFYDQSEIKHIIGLCDFFIGARMHACIAAISQSVPAVAIAYSDKFIGVMETVGVEGLVADARKSDQEEILRIVEKAYEQRAMFQQQLDRKIPEVRARVLSLFDGLSGFTRSGNFGFPDQALRGSQ